MKNEKFNCKKRLKSFVWAFRGIKYLLSHEHNAWIHCVIATVVIACGIFFGLSACEWIAITLCIGSVLCAEAFNTAIETLSDRISTEYDTAIKLAKDLAAGAVLIVSTASFAVGLIVFLPRLIHLIF